MSLAAVMNDTKGMFQDCRECLDGLERRIKFLEQENAGLRDEHYRDDLVASLKERIAEMEAEEPLGFHISVKENEALQDWLEQHEELHPGGHGCSGGKYTYIFIPTGLGTSGTVRCNCGAEFEFQKIR